MGNYGKRVAPSCGGYYKLEGDNFWHEMRIGSGPGQHPDPRQIGP